MSKPEIVQIDQGYTVVCCNRMGVALSRGVFQLVNSELDKPADVRPVFDYRFNPQYEGAYNLEYCPFCGYEILNSPLPKVVDKTAP